MESREDKEEKPSKLPLFLTLALLLALVACYLFIPTFRQELQSLFHILTSEDETQIRAYVDRFGFWGPAVIILALVLQMFLFVIPNILLIMISILSYGPLWGGLIAWTGILLASTVGYLIGRKLSPVTVKKLLSQKTRDKLSEFIREYGMKAIVVFRLSTFSNDGLSIVAGLLKMNYKRYMLATITGITPLIAAVAFFGKNGRIEKGLLWTGIVLMTLLVGFIIVDRRRKKKRGLVRSTS